MSELKPGDRVEWNAHGGRKSRVGKAVGCVIRKLTSPTNVGGHEAKASEERPQYLVESDRSGGRAAHHPDALRQLD